MNRTTYLLLLPVLWMGCTAPSTSEHPWKPYDESAALAAQAEHENVRMRYQLIQSRLSNPQHVWGAFHEALDAFGAEKYEELKPLILEQDFPSLQGHVASGKLTYEDLTTFYLYRMRKLEWDSTKTLHAVLALNPLAIEEAAACDAQRDKASHPIFGMPLLLKDNINTSTMPTTAGAAILENHYPPQDAHIVDRLTSKGAIILGKVNLSEWAYYFCDDCPLGYSAIGGQTLNPYGRMQFETGGSSAGSGVAVAANYAAAAIGTETSGSILSPSSKNAVVGLKPTVGLASRSGIVPISSTLDTPGPMTRFVIDNAIVLDAMAGPDASDAATLAAPADRNFLHAVLNSDLEGVRLGALAELMASDSLYRQAVADLRAAGAVVVECSPPEVDLNGFLSVLNGDMRRDLPAYFQSSSAPEVSMLDVAAVMTFNRADSALRMPYGQARLEGIVGDSISDEALRALIDTLHTRCRSFFDEPMQALELEGLISINNYHAAYAALAFYPGISVPMGYTAEGEPAGLTLFAPSHHEFELLGWAAGYEAQTRHRRLPSGYE